MTNIWSKFRSNKVVDGKPTWVIVDILGKITDESPTNEELKKLRTYRYMTTRYILKLPELERKECLLEFLRYFHKKEGTTPKIEDFTNNPKYPSHTTYWRVFGSWSNASTEAGLEANRYSHMSYTDKELLEFLTQFYEENGVPPVAKDFQRDPRYPNFREYIERFGGWQKALKLVGLDISSMVMKGILYNKQQKGRLGEIFVKNHFTEIEKVIDLSGEDHNSPYDGICPKGYNYDVKCSSLENYRWGFGLDNIDADNIEWYYLLAFNKEYTELLHVWRIPTWDFIEKIESGRIYIYNSDCNIEKMKGYEITEKFVPIFENWLSNIGKKNRNKNAN